MKILPKLKTNNLSTENNKRDYQFKSITQSLQSFTVVEFFKEILIKNSRIIYKIFFYMLTVSNVTKYF